MKRGRRRGRTYGEEYEDVAFGLGCVNLKDGGNCGVEVVSLRLGRVVDVDGVSSSGNYG